MLGTILFRTAAAFPDNIAISGGDIKLTYRELEDSVARIAAALQACVQPGDRVACYLHNGSEIIEITHACFRIGVSVVFISPFFKATEARNILIECKPRVMFTEHEIYQSVIKPIIPQLPFIEVTCLRLPTPAAPAGTCSLVDFKHSASCRNDAPISTNLDDHEAGVFYTSGSTGSIKGISHCHSKLMADVTEKVRHFALCGDDRILLCEPLCGNPLPLVFAVLPAALSGAQVTWLPTDNSLIGTAYEATIERAIRALVRDRITYLVTSPFTLRALVKRLESAEQISSQLMLRCCIVGGDVIPEDTYNRFRAIFGFPVCEMYGLTEALSCAIASVDESAPKGKYMPFGDMQFRIIDESWTPLPVGSVGEIAVHSTLVMRGYVNDPETTALVLQDGWLKTGDLGYLDRDGSLRFVGRRKHVICYDGENIGPQEVESALLDHPRILEACVVGIPSQRNGEVPAAYVVTSSVDPPIAYEEIAAFLIERLASHKIPVAIRFMDALPRNVNRKIDRKLLIARAREDFADAIAVESECD